MPYFALIYDLVDDFPARRTPFREEHLRLAREAHARGELIYGGALAEPPDRALIIFQVENKSAVENFAQQDPYVTNGLVKHWTARPWNVVVGNETDAAKASRAS